MVFLFSLNLFCTKEDGEVKDSYRTQSEPQGPGWGSTPSSGPTAHFRSYPRLTGPVLVWAAWSTPRSCPLSLWAEHIAGNWPCRGNPHPQPRGIPALTFVIIPVQSSFVFFSSPLCEVLDSLPSLQCVRDVSEIDDWDVSGLYDDE